MRTKTELLLAAVVIMILLPAYRTSALEQVPFVIEQHGTEENDTAERGESLFIYADMSGCHLEKRKDGYWCVSEDGQPHSKNSVHYIQHCNTGSIQLNGFYAHDQTGRYCADEGKLIALESESVMGVPFNGIYRTGLLGRLGSALGIERVDQTVGQMVLKGDYCLDSYGKLDTTRGLKRIKGQAGDRKFDGIYPFLEENGGLSVPAASDETENSGRMEQLMRRISETVSGYEGEWSIYIRAVEENETLILNDRQMRPASMIKLFVMEMAYSNREQILKGLSAILNTGPEDPRTAQRLTDLIRNMVVYSDNESFNELVRLQDPGHSFSAGCEIINSYLKDQEYKNSAVQHTLSPSESPDEGIGESNYSSARDCGRLLEKIFRGECVDEASSCEMISLLLEQDNKTKIGTGLPPGVLSANKTGETAALQHDAGIIYCPDVTLILSIFSENCPEEAAVDHIRELTRICCGLAGQ